MQGTAIRGKRSGGEPSQGELPGSGLGAVLEQARDGCSSTQCQSPLTRRFPHDPLDQGSRRHPHTQLDLVENR